MKTTLQVRRKRAKVMQQTIPWPALPLAAILALALAPATTAAQEKSSLELADLSIEELMQETVTSVSRREQKLGDVASAISVLTSDEIRRSGATTIPDALRLVPGMNVGSVNAHEWAVSVRGFNNAFSNKLLVLVDGRAVYSPLFSGVFWDLQQTMLDDVDRIEVIRGPGATVWGANAVNGVISVISRSAKETQGGLLHGGGGTHQAAAAVRYGGQIGADTYYRIFGGTQSNANHPSAGGESAGDRWHARHGGFRFDHYPDRDTHLTWQADTSVTDYDSAASRNDNVNTLGRWTRRLGERSNVEVQAYYDRTSVDDMRRVPVAADTFDLSAQHTFGFGERNDVIWGLGYRASEIKGRQSGSAIHIRTDQIGLRVFSAFVQDEFRLVPDKLTLTAGLKVEHNDYTGFEFQPSVRAVLKPGAQQTAWAAISRAVRTPSALEGKDLFGIVVGPPLPGPGGGLFVPTLVGNGDVRSEVLWGYELGYRILPDKRVSVDLAAFRNHYSGLISTANGGRFVPGTPLGTLEIPWANVFGADSYGAEAGMTFAPVETLRLTAGYSLLFMRVHGTAAGNGLPTERSAPMHQVSLRASYDMTKRASLDMRLRYLGAIESVSRYVAADLRLSYRPDERLEFSLVGQNLFDNRHPEQGAAFLTVVSQVPRSLYGAIRWRF